MQSFVPGVSGIDHKRQGPFGAAGLGLLLAVFVSGANAETVREEQIVDTVVAYDADRFRIMSRGTDTMAIGCRDEECRPGIEVSAKRSACGDPSEERPRPDRSSTDWKSEAPVIFNGLAFQLMRRDNRCRNLVPPSFYACVEIGANAIKFSQSVIGCRHGPFAKPDMIQFLAAVRLRPAEPR